VFARSEVRFSPCGTQLGFRPPFLLWRNLGALVRRRNVFDLPYEHLGIAFALARGGYPYIHGTNSERSQPEDWGALLVLLTHQFIIPLGTRWPERVVLWIDAAALSRIRSPCRRAMAADLFCLHGKLYLPLFPSCEEIIFSASTAAASGRAGDRSAPGLESPFPRLSSSFRLMFQ